jgi:hypothetical protein
LNRKIALILFFLCLVSVVYSQTGNIASYLGATKDDITRPPYGLGTPTKVLNNGYLLEYDVSNRDTLNLLSRKTIRLYISPFTHKVTKIFTVHKYSSSKEFDEAGYIFFDPYRLNVTSETEQAIHAEIRTKDFFLEVSAFMREFVIELTFTESY